MTDDLAARLLDAQVEFALSQLTDPDAFAEIAREEITAFLADASHLTLSEAVSRDMIKAVAHKYAIAFPVEGAIPELVGQVAARLYRLSRDGDVRLPDVIDRKHFDELAAGVADLGITRRLVDRVLDSPVTVDAAVDVVQRAVDSSRLPERLGRIVDASVEKVTRRGARFVLSANRNDSDELVADALSDVWRAGSDNNTVGLVEPGDVEDVVVLIFEFWRTFRDTDYFAGLLSEGVDEVFEAYGDTPLAELLAELGVGYDDLVEEAMRFGPHVIAEVDRRGFLEAAVRRRLAPFYASEAFAAAVDPAS
ncbi:hypothetical protein nbrc107696_42860 [Gordonia spumicola]|uniref:Uncharacterized protein n=1 Tax=Gordonia spumicola TaxID=589161 RepID=A0A7I9VFP4_9ACTN|nr:hypothetical protein [Gordonia spumicola]GEE03840.1 hypothetical protein nbrc107696_42860 [Gordonia spumicola]